MENKQLRKDTNTNILKRNRKAITVVLLALTITVGTVGTALSIEVDQQGTTYQTTTYKFNFLGGLLG